MSVPHITLHPGLVCRNRERKRAPLWATTVFSEVLLNVSRSSESPWFVFFVALIWFTEKSSTSEEIVLLQLFRAQGHPNLLRSLIRVLFGSLNLHSLSNSFQYLLGFFSSFGCVFWWFVWGIGDLFLCCEVGGPEESLELLINKHNIELSSASTEIVKHSASCLPGSHTRSFIVCSALIILVCVSVGVREKINSAELHVLSHMITIQWGLCEQQFLCFSRSHVYHKSPKHWLFTAKCYMWANP